MRPFTKLISAAALCVASFATQAAPVSVYFLGADGNLDAVKDDILGTDARFDSANSAVFNEAYGTPTLDTLKQYNSVLLWTNYWPADSTALGNVLADYVDAGGRVVLSTFVGQEMQGSGRIFTTGYNPFTSGTFDAYNSACLGTYNASSPLMNGVSSICSSYYRGDWNPGLDTGASLVASWDDGKPFVGVNAAGNVIDISLFPNVVSYGHASGDYAQLFRNALAFENAPTSNVPEPGTMALFGLGLAGAAAARRRRK